MSVLTAVARSDERFALRLAQASPPRWLRRYMLIATRLGDGWLWLLTALALSLGGAPCHQVLATAAVAAAVANLILVLVKGRVRRPRPSEVGLRPSLGSAPRVRLPSDRFSFPSGHTLNAFAVGSVLALAFPLLAPAALLVASSVAASRVFLGVHYVSDALAGAVIGLLVGGSCWQLLLG